MYHRSTPQPPTGVPQGMLGMLDIEHAAKKKQLLMKHRIQDNASELMKITINSNIKGGWKQRTDKLKNELDIQAQDYRKSKQTFKIDIENKISKMFHDTLRSNLLLFFSL